ncbi:MAG: ATP-binding protein [Flavobacteriales bacterium]|nr:ATP-binding protein [Flavobacteriales bacterium]
MGTLTEGVEFTERIDFPSRVENISLVEKLIDDVCTRHNVHESHYGNILIALTEAVNNAIHHGNRQDPTKQVEVGYRYHNGKVTFWVKDQGPGFDHDHLPDPTDPQNIEKPHGRGVFLMRALADMVAFDDHGSTVAMTFSTQPV